MVNKAGDSKREDDAEMEIESHALRNLNDPSSAAALDRRSSLDRSHTMPAPSWEEGDQILRVRLDDIQLLAVKTMADHLASATRSTGLSSSQSCKRGRSHQQQGK